MYKSKRALLLVIVTLVLSMSWAEAFAQWSSVLVPRGRHLHGIHINHYNRYVVIGGNPVNDSIRSIFVTNDGGQNFDLTEDVIAPWYQGVSFPSLQVGYVVGYNGIINKTTDGGATWNQITTVTGNARFRHYNGVHFINDNVGYIVGGNKTNDSIQTILKTTDGGATWSTQRDNLGYWLKSIYAVDANTAYAVGERGVILKTTDGGSNWTALTLMGGPSNRTFNAVYFQNASTGIAVGGNKTNDSIQTIIRTTDGGANWSVIADNLAPWLNDVKFVNANTGYAVGDRGAILKTTDGGNNWNAMTIAQNDTFNWNALDIFNADYFIVVGDHGRVLSYLAVNPSLPTAKTDPPTNVRDSSVRLNATVNANGATVVVSFEYGNSMALGSTIAGNPDTVTGSTNTSVSATLTGLDPTDIYYYRVKAVSAGGTVYGDTMRFYLGNDIPNWDFEIWDSVVAFTPSPWQALGGVSQVTSYDATTAVRLTSDSRDDVGAVILGTIGDNGPEGGYPFAARPDSLTGYFNYDIASGDTAYILLFMKYGGSPISQDMVPITGTSGGTFQRLSFPISYGTPDVPDSVIIGIVSGNAFGTPNPNSVLTVDNLAFTGTTLDIPNGEFENWDTTSGLLLNNWRTSQHELPISAGISLVERVMDKAHGDYAVKIQNNTAVSQYPTRLQAGNDEKFAINHVHTTLNGYFKWIPQSNDTLNIYLSVFSGGNYIGGGNFQQISAVNDWTGFNILIYYSGSAIPDSAQVNIQSGGQNALGNSVAYIDYLSFDGLRDTNTVTPGIFDQWNKLKNWYVKAYPNPVQDLINLEFFVDTDQITNLSTITYTVLDLTGKIVYIDNQLVSNSGMVRKTISMENLPTGTYLININAGTGSKTVRVVRQ